MLKWPNDLMLSGKKLAGILLERSGDRVAVGFGVNLASGAAIAGPPDARRSAARSRRRRSRRCSPASFARMLELWRTNETAALARAWQERAHPSGPRLTVHASKDETISGRFGGLEPDGALRLMLDDGSIEVIRAGDVLLELRSLSRVISPPWKSCYGACSFRDRVERLTDL